VPSARLFPRAGCQYDPLTVMFTTEAPSAEVVAFYRDLALIYLTHPGED